MPRTVRGIVVSAMSAVALAGLSATFALLLITHRQQTRLERITTRIMEDESIAQQIVNAVDQQLFLTVQNLHRPSTQTETQFRDTGMEVYRSIRRYLVRDLTTTERLLVERIKEHHEILEVTAQDAFALSLMRDPLPAEARTLDVINHARALQAEVARFLAERRAQRGALSSRQQGAVSLLFVSTGLLTALLASVVIAVASLLQRRLVHPLKLLNEAATRLGERDDTIRVPIEHNDEIGHLGGSFNELAQRLETERAATLLAKQRYIQLVSTIHSIVWEADAQTFRCTFISRFAEVLLGYPIEEWLAAPDIWRRVIHPEDFDRVSEAWRIASAHGQNQELEYRALTAAGETVWLHDNINVIAHGDGAIQLRGVMFDVTRQKAAEEALRQSERRFRALIENSSDTITVIGPDGRTRYAGPSIARMLGYDPEERVGHSVFEIVHPDDWSRVRSGIAQTLADPDDANTLVVRAKHKDGSWRWLEARGTNMMNVPGVEGIVVNSRDITDRRQAEEALAASEANLRQAQKMEAIGLLAGGVAHDFNNLLAAIKGHTQILLEDTPLDSHQTEDLTEIVHAADRAAELTRQLLAFSRQQILQVDVLDLNSVISDMHRMLRRLIGTNIEFQTILTPSAPRVRADRTQLEQVLLNLAVNARDAMPEDGSITIQTSNVEVTPEEAGSRPGMIAGDYVLLRFSDTGLGMSAEVAARIFDPFFTTKGLGKGTGLGLATVHGIINQSGGHIAVESQIGKGTSFLIWLPTVDQPITPRRQPVDTTNVRGHETVLLVEDEDAVRALARRLLERRGYHVLEATNGPEALEVVGGVGQTIDALITDLVMPRMNGIHLAEAIRKILPEVGVVLMSGYSEDEVVRVDGGLPGAVFLGKPFDIENLIAAIVESLQRAPREMPCIRQP